jgi:hypothetical protein
MIQTQHTPAQSPAPAALAWREALQLKLMAALDAAWAMIEGSDDPAVIRAARDRAKAAGDIAVMGRKVLNFEPARRASAGADLSAQAEKLAKVMAPGLAAEALNSVLKPASAPQGAAQAEHTRRALEKLKGGGRARL